MTEQERRTYAWLGDAVLALYARQFVLQDAHTPAEEQFEAYTHLTSNQFLACLGKPTHIEAEIGLIYTRAGLAQAFSHIEATLLPLFRKQRANRRKNRPAA